MKTYIVLSVKQITALAFAAKRSQKAHRAKNSHTVSLYLGAVPGYAVNGREQLSSTDFVASVEGIEADAARRAALDTPTPSV